MRILIAPDSFKESLTALEAAQAIQSGFQEVFVQAEYDLLPIGDGGEGTVSSLADSLRLKRQTAVVTNAFGKTKKSSTLQTVKLRFLKWQKSSD